jgi:hypothetical protein
VTVAETALPNFALCAWLGLLGPAGIPAPILGMLNPATNVALRHPETAEMEAHLERELSRWADLARHVHFEVANYKRAALPRRLLTLPSAA